MDDQRKYQIFKLLFIIIIVGIVGYLFYRHNTPVNKTPVMAPAKIQTAEQVQQAADKAGVHLTDEQSDNVQRQIKTAKPSGSVTATAGTVQQMAEEQRRKNGSDFAPIVAENDLKALPDNTPVELKQYHIYAASKVQQEIGLKLDRDSSSHITGVSYGIKRRIANSGKYIGARVDYDWKDKEAAVWATYTW